jgi:hypothetical protein
MCIEKVWLLDILQHINYTPEHKEGSNLAKSSRDVFRHFARVPARS